MCKVKRSKVYEESAVLCGGKESCSGAGKLTISFPLLYNAHYSSHQQYHARKGFTLIELLVVVAIMGLLKNIVFVFLANIGSVSK